MRSIVSQRVPFCYWCAICFLVLYVAPRLAYCLSAWRECEGVFWWLILFWLILR